MANNVKAQNLTTPRSIITTVPFPASDVAIPTVTEPKDGQARNVVLSVCSEFAEYRSNLEVFEPNEKLRLAYDPLGQPVVLTIDESKVSIKHMEAIVDGLIRFD